MVCQWPSEFLQTSATSFPLASSSRHTRVATLSKRPHRQKRPHKGMGRRRRRITLKICELNRTNSLVGGTLNKIQPQICFGGAIEPSRFWREPRKVAPRSLLSRSRGGGRAPSARVGQQGIMTPTGEMEWWAPRACCEPLVPPQLGGVRQSWANNKPNSLGMLTDVLAALRSVPPWTSLVCVSSPKCVYMCVTKCVCMCVTKCVCMCVTKCVHMCVTNSQRSLLRLLAFARFVRTFLNSLNWNSCPKSVLVWKLILVQMTESLNNKNASVFRQ